MRLTVLSSMATRHILAEHAEEFQQRTGYVLSVSSMGGVDAVKRVHAGEPFDVIVLARNALEKLAAEGLVVKNNCVDFARSGIAIAVAEGAPVPDIHNGAAVRTAMLAAHHVGYSTGPSGDYLQSLWDRWAIADIMTARAVLAPPGVPVAKLVADGIADLGFQQLSELQGQPGIIIAGLLPPDIQNMTIFAAAIATASRHQDMARSFIASLVSANAHAILKRHGMQSVS